MEEIDMAKIKRDPRTEELAKMIIDQYRPESLSDMNDALKDIFGPLLETMLKGEMDDHLGYKSNDKGQKLNDNRRQWLW